MLGWVDERDARALRNLVVLTIFASGAYVTQFVAMVPEPGQPYTPQRLGLSIGIATLFIVVTDIVTRRGFAITGRIITRFRRIVADQIATAPLAEVERLPMPFIKATLEDMPRAFGEGLAFTVRSSWLIWTFLFIPFLLAIRHPSIAGPMAILILLSVMLTLGIFVASLSEGREAERSEDTITWAASDLINGFAEMRLNAKRRKTLIEQTLLPAIQAKPATQRPMRMLNAGVYGMSIMTPVAIVFMLVAFGPLLVGSSPAALFAGGLVAIVLPYSIFARMTIYVRLFNAIRAADDVIRQVQALPKTDVDAGISAAPKRLENALHVKGVAYRYPPSTSRYRFGVGPLDFVMPGGTITFLTGGNGAGKSTAIKAITGLYAPDAGQVLADGSALAPLTDSGTFSAILADSHVFDCAYGLFDKSPALVHTVLKQVQIDHKVRVENGRFSTVDLSTGQRKRLLLALAILEDRPVMVLDEWAAEQDPEFRKWFYREFLPEQRAQGRTILAATHDDAYFDAADYRLHFEGGKIVRRY